jgi:hypothetical protein
MTRDDIIRMAREVGDLKCDCCLPYYEETDIEGFEEFLERFAELVEAAEREKLKHELLTLEKWKGMALAKDGDGRTVQEIEREAREAEREACAKLCEAEGERVDSSWVSCAAAIRARGLAQLNAAAEANGEEL